MDELISRQAVIDAVTDELDNIDHVPQWVYDRLENRIMKLPPIQPVIAPCDYAKACNEATMDKLTSAVAYYDVLEELRKHGYVLVDMREVKHESN